MAESLLIVHQGLKEAAKGEAGGEGEVRVQAQRARSGQIWTALAI